MLISYNLLYLCLALLLEAKWILLKTKAFTQTEISAPKFNLQNHILCGNGIVWVGGVYYVWWCPYFFSSVGCVWFKCLCMFRADVCKDHRFHLHACTYTHILYRIEYTITFSVLLVVIPPTCPFFAFKSSLLLGHCKLWNNMHYIWKPSKPSELKELVLQSTGATTQTHETTQHMKHGQFCRLWFWLFGTSHT